MAAAWCDQCDAAPPLLLDSCPYSACTFISRYLLNTLLIVSTKVLIKL